MSSKMRYLEKENNTNKVIRTEILLTPFLVFFPLFIGIIFIYDWYNRGVVEGSAGFFGTFLLGIIILICNIIFDIPFIKSLKQLTLLKKKK